LKAAEAAAIAADNARAEPVFISGATGDKAALINGVFVPTRMKGLDGRVLYAKLGDASTRIEHYGGQWQVKAVSNIGANNCWISVVGGCGLEARTSRLGWEWLQWDGKSAHYAPLVKCMEWKEAEVKRCFACSCSPSQLTPANASLLTSRIADSRRQAQKS
jgi:hypothetical protein